MFRQVIGLSALRANQVGMDVIAQNIANASTPGYHRQVAQFADLGSVERFDLQLGSGVGIKQIQQLRSSAVEQSITQNKSDAENVTNRLDTLQRIESLLTLRDNSLPNAVADFFNQLELLTTSPSDSVQRQSVIRSAGRMTAEFRNVETESRRITNNIDAEIRETVNQINGLAAELSDLGKKIQRAESRGLQPHDLRDQRDQLLNSLAELVDVQINPQPNSADTILVAQGSGLIGSTPPVFEAYLDSDGSVRMRQAGTTHALNVGGGQLAGLLHSRNEIVPDIREQLGDLARDLMHSIDRQHAQGLGTEGPVQFMHGSRVVSDPAVPLSEAETSFPVEAGILMVSVTDEATGTRTSVRLNIDPETDSLTDVAAAISGVANLQALVEPQTGQLSILAADGYRFDFAGRLPTAVETTTLTGTATPVVSGSYSGSTNDEYTFRINGTGVIGLTPGVSVDVFDSSGTLLSSQEVGAGYEPGSPLTIVNGISMRLGPGTVNDGESFGSSVIADSDTGGLLAALGLNSFFTGSQLNDLAVDPSLLADDALMSSSKTGEPGDSRMIRSLLEIRDAARNADESLTIEQSLASIIATVGSHTRELSQVANSLQLVSERLELERQHISGVDPNEELVQLIEFQRSFQAAANYISVVDDSMTELFRMIR